MLLRVTIGVGMIALCVSLCGAQSQHMREEVIERALADSHAGPNFAIAAAAIRSGNTLRGNAMLDTLLRAPKGDMFWMYGCAGLYCTCEEILDAASKAKIRACWKRFTPYRGDTENHFLMYYGSLLLMSEAWPDLDSTAWFTGQSSKEIHAQAVQYLMKWIDQCARYGPIEWDSPRYEYYMITPLALLANYAQDGELRRKCTMLLELHLAEYAQNYFEGEYAGAHSRTSEQAAIEPRTAEVGAYGDYFFSDTLTRFEPDVVFTALGTWQLPTIIREISRQRTVPYLTQSIARSRPALRDSIETREVHRVTSMNADYALGSIAGGIVQPIQQQSWSLLVKSNDGGNAIFSLQPYASGGELGMYFPEDTAFMMARIGRVKTGYTGDTKWVGGSPYEHIAQTAHTLVARYAIAREAPYHHVDLLIPHSHDVQILSRADRASNGTEWIALRAGNTYVGVNISQGAVWQSEGSHYRVRIDRDTSTLWLVLQEDAAHRDANVFRSTLAVLHPTLIGDTATYRDPFYSEVVTVVHDEPHAPSDTTMLFDSPFVTSQLGSGLIRLHTHKQKLILDFNEGREY